MLEERTQFQWLLSDSTLNPSTCNLNQMWIPQIFCLRQTTLPTLLTCISLTYLWAQRNWRVNSTIIKSKTDRNKLHKLRKAWWISDHSSIYRRILFTHPTVYSLTHPWCCHWYYLKAEWPGLFCCQLPTHRVQLLQHKQICEEVHKPSFWAVVPQGVKFAYKFSSVSVQNDIPNM